MYLWKETQVDTKLLKYLNKRLTSLFSKSLNFTIQFEVINRGAFTILKNYENKLPNLIGSHRWARYAHRWARYAHKIENIRIINCLEGLTP